jgi:hypothetical protein
MTKKYENQYNILKKYAIKDEWELINSITIWVPYMDNRENHFGWTMIIREDDRPNIYKEFEKTLPLYV